MAILETEVFIIPNSNIDYYENLRYEIPKRKDKQGRLKIPKGTTILVKIEHLPISSIVLVTKVCDFCGELVKNQRYEKVIRSRSSGNGMDCCSKCRGVKSWESRRDRMPLENSLEFVAREKDMEYLLNEFSVKNIIRTIDISYGSGEIYLWNCSVCKSEYGASPSYRFANRGCPYCSGKKINHTNCLTVTHSDLAKEWHPILNGTLTPNDITKGSSKIVWWLCSDCDTPYDISVGIRTNGQNCPYCAGARVNYKNCLKTNFPEIAKEWNYVLNGKLTPFDVTKASVKKVWWSCCECNNPYKATVANRTSGGTGCPVCSSSKGNKKISKFLNENNIIHSDTEYRFENCRNKNTLPFDFVIFDNDNNQIKLLIEYDGVQHFKPTHFGGTKEKVEEAFVQTQINDKIKNDFCINNNIPLLRIPYWEFDNIETILSHTLFGEGGEFA